MRSYESLMEELDATQRAAATVRGNAVIAAGAGSGKTRVLAARYAHLVVERGFPPSSILALTFTRKAAAEMYSRIHATLRDTDHPAAREAVANFSFARIDTIDSFCNSVARAACRSYGIAPEFSIDDERAESLADELALSFLLERRASPVIGQLMKRYALAELPSRFFAQTMVRHSPITHPLDLAATFARQKDATARGIESALDSAYASFAALSGLGRGTKTLDDIADLLSSVPDRPDPSDRASFVAFLSFSSRLAKVRLPGNATKEALKMAKELCQEYREKAHAPLLALANFSLNEDIIRDAFSLLAEFQSLFAQKKREAGLLTFTDVSRMALDALTDDPSLRASYKATFKSIMIDEFQDDNDLQRDLLFLLAERADRTEKTVPRADELSEDKLFFVGDEKQSIYRFRGADVSVFRSLARELGSAGAKPLATNYRSERALIVSFNEIFPTVFLDARREGRDVPPYEASFEPIAARPETKPEHGDSRGDNRDDERGVQRGAADEQASPIEILLIDAIKVAEASPEALSPDETEAAAVADRIAGLIESGFTIRDGDSTRPIAADDIAILFRTGRSQQLFESQLRERGVPCQSETIKSLFSDAPVNDIYSLLRLAVFPADDTAYAILLRSPFVGIGDEGFAIAMLARLSDDGQPKPEPFEADAASAMSEIDRAAFSRGGELWASIRDSVDRVSAHELVTRAWYAEGYRYLIETRRDLAPYRELFDYFFELARRSDERGETLATFLDGIAELRESEERINNIDIPVDRSGGVRLMTVHKSKGLEFPVVFLVDASNNGRGERNGEPVYLSREWGLSVNAGSPDGAENASVNWCYDEGRNEEISMALAELRRLLYVAMTRAERRLYVSAVVKIKRKEDDADFEPTARGLLEYLSEKRDKRKGAKDLSFLDLLLPALLAENAKNLTITAIDPILRSVRMREMRLRHPIESNADKGSAPVRKNPFEGLPLADYPSGPRRRYAASSLAEELFGTESDLSRAESTQKKEKQDDPLHRLMLEANISAADFGTLVHACIEARFEGRELPFIPEVIKEAVTAMAGRFIESRLGTLALAADWRATEYGFLTEYQHDGQTLIVSGQADLVFESEGAVYVVDYKSDREEDPERHAVQLAVYRKAMGDLRKKPVQTWLFYLRSGVATLVSG